MGKLFGTDGIRGIVGEDLTGKLAMNVGESSAYVLGDNSSMNVVVGRDTRISGQMLSSALSAGLMSQGANVIDLGVVPAPAVSYLVKKYGVSMGAMISASHNPSEYNGIKLFNNEGFKLPDETENEIEKYLFGKAIPSSNNIGKEVLAKKAIDDYVDYIISTSEYINPDLKIIDTAYVLETDYSPEELWLNPSSLLMMAQNVRLGLREYISSNVLIDEIDVAYDNLKVELSELDASYRIDVENTNNKIIIVANSTLKYLEKFFLDILMLN